MNSNIIHNFIQTILLDEKKDIATSCSVVYSITKIKTREQKVSFQVNKNRPPQNYYFHPQDRISFSSNLGTVISYDPSQ